MWCCPKAVVPSVIALLAIGALVGSRAAFREAPPAVTLAVEDASNETATVEQTEDQRLTQLALGTWRDFYQGKRTLTLNEDGTATMIVELTGLKARLFTPRLRLDMVWSIKNGEMHRRTVGGHPADKVQFVNNYAGESIVEPVVDVTERRMILSDKDGRQKYNWRRIK